MKTVVPVLFQCFIKKKKDFFLATKNPKIDSFNALAKWRESQVSPVHSFRIGAKRKMLPKNPDLGFTAIN